MKKTPKWFNEAQLAELKKEIIDLLHETPRARWSDVIIRNYSDNAAVRVAVFQLFCRMMDSGELDELKQSAPRETQRILRQQS